MSEVVAFSRYVGLVVVLLAAVLLAPRLTVSAWAGLVQGVRRRWASLLAWRPGTVVDDEVLVVEVVVGDRRATDPDEVLEAHGLPRWRQAVAEVWGLARELLEAGALLLALAGLALRTLASLLSALPEGAVLAGDLLLVLGAFLVMQRTIRDFPEEWLPRLSALARPQRVVGREGQLRAARARELGRVVVLAPAFAALLAWPLEIGRFVAEKQFTGPQSTVLVVWACELPWLVGLVWYLARPLLAPLRRPAGRHAARVVPIRSGAEVAEPARRAA